MEISSYYFDIEKNEIFSKKINQKIFLHIKWLSSKYSYLYFTDEMNKNISIPTSISLYHTINYGLYTKRELATPILPHSYYYLFYLEDYELEYYGENILSINKPNCWYITNKIIN
jgi:hypothetical protein